METINHTTQHTIINTTIAQLRHEEQTSKNEAWHDIQSNSFGEMIKNYILQIKRSTTLAIPWGRIDTSQSYDNYDHSERL